jgi:GT2 family glycosyltransferase
MISVIILNKDPVKLAAVEKMYRAAMGDHPWELIAVHGATSVAAEYNRHGPAARGDIVVFSHDDIEILSPDFPARLKEHLSRFDLIGVAGTDRLVSPNWHMAGPGHIFGQVTHVVPDGRMLLHIYGAPAPAVGNIVGLDGVFMAARRSVLMQMGFDAVNFDGFHLYDMDFTYRVARAGMRVGVANDINLLHFSSGTFDQVWEHYANKFTRKWSKQFQRCAVAEQQMTIIDVPSREQAMEIMRPAYWDDEL